MSLKKDQKEILIEAESSGWIVGKTRGGHVSLRRDGCPTLHTSSSPSDQRGLRNLRARIKRYTPKQEIVPMPVASKEKQLAKIAIRDKILDLVESSSRLDDSVLIQYMGMTKQALRAWRSKPEIAPHTSIDKLRTAYARLEDTATKPAVELPLKVASSPEITKKNVFMVQAELNLEKLDLNTVLDLLEQCNEEIRRRIREGTLSHG